MEICEAEAFKSTSKKIKVQGQKEGGAGFIFSSKTA